MEILILVGVVGALVAMTQVAVSMDRRMADEVRRATKRQVKVVPLAKMSSMKPVKQPKTRSIKLLGMEEVEAARSAQS